MIEKSNTNIEAQLWHAYSAPFFRFSMDWNSSRYAVITAWNPHSQLRSKKENCISNHELEKCLTNVNYVSVMVGDRSFDWFEDCYAAELSVEAAVMFAKQFEQNAIYYVVDERLYLIVCSAVDTWHDLGVITSRLI